MPYGTGGLRDFTGEEMHSIHIFFVYLQLSIFRIGFTSSLNMVSTDYSV